MACRTQVGASEEDVTRHMGFQDAISHAGKCLAACVEETLGIVIRITFHFLVTLYDKKIKNFIANLELGVKLVVK